MAHAILILQPLAVDDDLPPRITGVSAAGAFDLMSARGCALVPFVRGARKRDDQLVAVRRDLGGSAGPSGPSAP
eukprot:COSAG06_NODE_50131_length_320_cov_2.864253_1_plen_73_part_10